VEVLIVVVAVVVAGAVVLPLALRRGQRDGGRTDVDAVGRGHLPGPGEPAPRRGGEPVRGSGPDRARHGKP
jgi:hypothetical protein